MKRGTFLSLWPLKYEQAKWLIVRFRMEAADIKEPPATDWSLPTPTMRSTFSR